MRNPLQEQLLKAGLAKKSKLDQIAREQAKQRNAKAAPAPNTDHADAERARLDKVERDRALSAERNAQARAQEAGPVPFRKAVLNPQFYSEGIHFGDLDKDGALDIIAGPY